MLYNRKYYVIYLNSTVTHCTNSHMYLQCYNSFFKLIIGINIEFERNVRRRGPANSNQR